MSISNHRAADLLCSAFEGGSNYWCIIDHVVTPEEEAKPWGDEYTPTYISFPFSDGGAIVLGDIEDDEADLVTLNKKAIKRGIKLLETDPQYAHHYADVLQENDDATTGDVFLQLCVFGDVVFG